jgi:hypothetical protein
LLLGILVYPRSTNSTFDLSHHTSSMEKSKDVEAGKGPSSIPHWRLVWDQGLVTDEVMNWHYPGSGTDEDPYVVNWITNDPRNPMLFSKTKKWGLTALVAIATLAVAFVSSAYSGGIRQILVEFGASKEVGILGVSLFVLGFFAGAIGSSPLTNAGGVIADMFSANERGLAMTLFAAAPFMGPVLGPIVGGFVGETVGWRWVEGVMAIL